MLGLFSFVEDMEYAGERLLFPKTRILEMVGCLVLRRTKRTLKRGCFYSFYRVTSEVGPLP